MRRSFGRCILGTLSRARGQPGLCCTARAGLPPTDLAAPLDYTPPTGRWTCDRTGKRDWTLEDYNAGPARSTTAGPAGSTTRDRTHPQSPHITPLSLWHGSEAPGAGSPQPPPGTLAPSHPQMLHSPSPARHQAAAGHPGRLRAPARLAPAPRAATHITNCTAHGQRAAGTSVVGPAGRRARRPGPQPISTFHVRAAHAQGSARAIAPGPRQLPNMPITHTTRPAARSDARENPGQAGTSRIPNGSPASGSRAKRPGPFGTGLRQNSKWQLNAVFRICFSIWGNRVILSIWLLKPFDRWHEIFKSSTALLARIFCNPNYPLNLQFRFVDSATKLLRHPPPFAHRHSWRVNIGDLPTRSCPVKSVVQTRNTNR